MRAAEKRLLECLLEPEVKIQSRGAASVWVASWTSEQLLSAFCT